MSGHLNVEIKARCSNPEELHNKLLSLGADYRGEDHQVDTYFNCEKGRLKLRSGNIENSLIFYKRENSADAKSSEVEMDILPPENDIRSVLKASHGTKVEVDKFRKIYFIGNVKFHIDRVKDLGSFMEIEAIESEEFKTKDQLDKQCRFYIGELGVKKKDFIEVSYSDLLLESFKERIQREGKYFLGLIKNEVHEFNLSSPDHICYRTESKEEYEILKSSFDEISKLLIESEIGGRNIATYKLHNKICLDNWSVSVIELAAPKEGSNYESGFEHAEFVIEESFEGFMSSHPHYKWSTSSMNKEINPEIRIKLSDNLSVKFHHQSLEKVIEWEKNHL